MQGEKDKDQPFLILKGRRGNLIGVHKDYLLQYHRELWKYEEDCIKIKSVELECSEDIKALIKLQKACREEALSLLGFGSSRNGSESIGRNRVDERGV